MSESSHGEALFWKGFGRYFGSLFPEPFEVYFVKCL